MADKHLAFRPRSEFRRTITPEERRPKKIVSVWPGFLQIMHPSGYVHIPPCKPEEGVAYPVYDPVAKKVLADVKPHRVEHGIPYSFVLVGPDREREDAGEVVTKVYESISSRRHAMDVLGLADAGYDDLEERQVAPPVKTSSFFEQGLFVPEGDDPSEKELRDAVLRRDRWMDRAIKLGDGFWNQYHRHDMIPGDALIAAKFRNLSDRPWCQDVRPAAEMRCPACGDRDFSAGFKFCKACRNTIAYDADGTPYWVDDPARKPDRVLEVLGKRGA